MPKSSALRVSDVLLVPEAMAIPGSFIEAIKAGWKIAKETTVLAVDQRHRHGKVILHKKGYPQRLAVRYSASAKLGYHYGKPEVI